MSGAGTQTMQNAAFCFHKGHQNRCCCNLRCGCPGVCFWIRWSRPKCHRCSLQLIRKRALKVFSCRHRHLHSLAVLPIAKIGPRHSWCFTVVSNSFVYRMVWKPAHVGSVVFQDCVSKHVVFPMWRPESKFNDSMWFDANSKLGLKNFNLHHFQEKSHGLETFENREHGEMPRWGPWGREKALWVPSGTLNVANEYMGVLNVATSGAATFRSACWRSIHCSSSGAWKNTKSSANFGVLVVWMKHISTALCCTLLLQDPVLQTITIM